MTDNPSTPAHPQHNVSNDQRLALKAAAERLISEFGDTFDAETIDRFLYTAHAHFAHHAPVPNFLPLLAERFAQKQLRALDAVAWSGGSDPSDQVTSAVVQASVDVMRSGCSTTPRAGTSRPCVPFAMRSNSEYAVCSPNSMFPSARSR
jgi:hypothetical protein